MIESLARIDKFIWLLAGNGDRGMSRQLVSGQTRRPEPVMRHEFTAWRRGCHRLLPGDALRSGVEKRHLRATAASRLSGATGPRSDREFARRPHGTYWPGHTHGAGRPGRRPSRWARILRTAPINSSAVFGDVKPLGVEAALGDRRRDDWPARAHRVHDLRRVAGPVERVIHAIGNERDVERLVIRREVVLRAPAQRMHVRARQEPRARRSTRACRPGRAPGQRRRSRRRERLADPVHQLPVDAVFERADVAEIRARQVRQIGRGPGRTDERLRGPKTTSVRRAGRGEFARPLPGPSDLKLIGPQARHADRQVGQANHRPLQLADPLGRAGPVQARSRRCCSRPTHPGEAGRAGEDNAGTTSPARAARCAVAGSTIRESTGRSAAFRAAG